MDEVVAIKQKLGKLEARVEDIQSDIDELYERLRNLEQDYMEESVVEFEPEYED